MATYYSPKIVTNGLVLALDAANRKSYNSGSTTWYDLSGNNKNFVLQNSPTYSTNNSGYFTFDGIDDNAYLISWSWPATASVSFFVYPINSVGSTYGRMMSTGNGDGFEIAIDTSNRVSYYTPTNSWQNQIVTLNNNWNLLTFSQSGTSVTVYKNDTVAYTGSLTTTAGLTMYLGNRYTGGEPSNVRISNFLVYNRTLTQADVTQNYNATKTRFGLI